MSSKTVLPLIYKKIKSEGGPAGKVQRERGKNRIRKNGI